MLDNIVEVESSRGRRRKVSGLLSSRITIRSAPSASPLERSSVANSPPPRGGDDDGGGGGEVAALQLRTYFT